MFFIIRGRRILAAREVIDLYGVEVEDALCAGRVVCWALLVCLRDLNLRRQVCVCLTVVART